MLQGQDNIDIRFIASEAGVSAATVSRVINGSKPVSPALRQRVMDVLARYKYRPNPAARELSAKRTNLIGVVTPSVSRSFHAGLLAGIEQEARRLGYYVLVSNLSEKPDFGQEKECFELLWERNVDGIILVHENTVEELRELREIAGIPMVLSSINIPESEVPSVHIDDERAAYDMVSYLARLGHKEIAGVFNDCYSLNVLRRKGFVKALEDNGLTPRPEWMRLADCTFEAGKQAAGQIFSGREKPSALFCVSDEIAIGAMNYLYDIGFNIPNDISIAGFDGIDLSGLVRPRLTTVCQPIREIGAASMIKLAELIKGDGTKTDELILPHHIKIRGSTVNKGGNH